MSESVRDRIASVLDSRGFRAFVGSTEVRDPAHVQLLARAIARILMCRSWGPSHLQPQRTTSIVDEAMITLIRVSHGGYPIVDQDLKCRYMVTTQVGGKYDMEWWIDFGSDGSLYKIRIKGSNHVEKFAWVGIELVAFLKEVDHAN